MPTQWVEQVVFLQGDDAKEVFRLMYPDGKSYGSDKTMRAALDQMKSYQTDSAWDTHERVEQFVVFGTTGTYRTKDHILAWNYPQCWIALYRRLTKKQAGR